MSTPHDTPNSCYLSATLKYLTAVLVVISFTAPAAPQDTTGPARERFVPVDQMQTIFDRSPNGVLLQRDVFDKLLQKAQQAEANLQDIPEKFIIHDAAYRVTQQDRHVLVNLTINIEQFVDQWVAVPILLGNLLVESATIEDQPAAINRGPANGSSLILVHEEAKRYTLKLRLSTTLAKVGTDDVAAIRLLPNVPSTLSILCPPNRHVEVNNLQLNRPAAIDQIAEYEVPMGNLQEARLKWTTRQKQNDDRTLVFAESDITATLSSGNMRWTSETRVSVFGTAINQLIASVPRELEITNVESEGLEDWKLEDDPDNPSSTRLLLNYRQPFSNDRIVKTFAVAPWVSGTTHTFPSLSFADITAHNGRLIVQQEDQLRLQFRPVVGIRPVGPDVTSRSELVSGGAEVFDFWSQNYELNVVARPRSRELFADVTSTLTVNDTLLTYVGDLKLEAINAALFEISLRLPEGWALTKVANPDNESLSWRYSDGPNRIVVEPNKPAASGTIVALNVVLSKTISDLTTPESLALPVVVVDDAQQVGGNYVISADNDLTIAPEELTGLFPLGDSSGVLRFETRGSPTGGKLLLSRKPARLTARSVLKTWMDTRQKTVEAEVTVDVVNGTTRTLQLEVPEAMGPDMRFQIAALTQVPGFLDQQVPSDLKIRQQKPGEQKEGIQTYEITFDRRFQGALTLTTTVQQTRQPDAKLSAPFVRVMGAVRQHGLVVFEALPDQELIPSSKPQSQAGLEPADSSLVNPPPTETGRRTALVYRYVAPGYTIDIAEQRYQTVAVPSAVCRKINNISVLSSSGRVQRSSCIHFICSGVQTLRFGLPASEQTHLWSTILNGEAIEVRRDGDDYLVAIPTQQPKSGHVLEVLFESESQNNTGIVHQQTVTLAIDSEQGQASPIDILEQTWEVRYPPTAKLVHHQGNFQLKHAIAPAGWIQNFATLLKLPSRETAWQRVLPLAVAGIILFILTALIVRRRWLSIIGVVLFGILVVSFLLPAAQQAGVTANATALFDEDRDIDLNAGTGLVMETFEEEKPTDAPEAVIADNERFKDALRDARQPETESKRDFAPQNSAEFDGGNKQQGGQAGNTSLFFHDETIAANDPFQSSPDDQNGDTNQRGLAAATNPQASESGKSQVDRVTGIAASGSQQEDLSRFDGRVADTRRFGTARLSVQAAIASPADYRRVEFYSISGTDSEQSLRLVVREIAYLGAVRIIAAAIIVLIGLVMQSRFGSTKVLFAILSFLTTLAVVPFVPNQWQPAVDGIFLGTLVVVTIWMLRSICECCCRQLISWKKNGCCGLFRSSAAITSIVATITLSVTCDATLAVNPDENQALEDRQQTSPSDLRPDVVRPYSPGQPELLADKVFLPQADFLKLYNKANPGTLEKSPNPATNAVVAAFYVSGELIQVDGNSWIQKLTARYVVTTYDQNAIVALPIGRVGIRSARLDDSPAIILTKQVDAQPQPLIRTTPPNSAEQQQKPKVQQLSPAILEPNSPVAIYSIQIPQPGLHAIDLEFTIPATVEGPIGHFDLPLVPVASGTLTFRIPKDNMEATVNGRSDAFRKDNNDMTLPVAAGGSIRIEWRPRSSTISSNTIFHASVNSALVLNDAGLTSRSTVACQVRQGQLAEVDIIIPANYAVQKVDCGNVASWQVTQTDGVSRLNALFLTPVKGKETLNITLFRRQPFNSQEQKLSVPLPAIEGASRDSGNATVIAGRELEIRVDSLSGVSQLNAAQATLPEGIDDSARRVIAWRYTRHPAEISVRVFRTEDRMIANSQHGVHIDANRQLWTSLFNVNIVGSPQRRLVVELPEQFTVLDVNGNDLEDWYQTNNTENQASGKLLQLKFKEPQTGGVSVVLQGERDEDITGAKTELQPPVVRDADAESSSALSVWLDAAWTLRNVTAAGWTKTPPSTAIRSLRPEPPAVSLSSRNNARQPIVITTDESAPAFVAESVSVTNVTSTSVELTLGMNWEISENAASRQFSFSLPAALADIFDFQIAGLRQLDRATAGDRAIFTIQLQQAISGRLFVLGTGTLPLPESGRISPQPPQFLVPPQSKSTLTNQSHFWVLVNQSSGLLQSEADKADKADKTDEATASDIGISIPAELLEQAVTIRRLRTDGATAHWQLAFPKQQEVTPAVVVLAAHSTIIDRDGSWRSRHTLQVRNESRQFLPVIIPESSRFLYATVKGQPTRVVSRVQNDGTLYLIPIPQSGTVATPFDLEFVISGQINLDDLHSLTIPSPVFPEYRDSPEFGITVNRNTWSVYVPDEWLVSPIDNPRKTNVIQASAADFEDAAVFSGIDNLKSMLNSLSLKSEGSFRNHSILYSFSKQRTLLESQRGNSEQAEKERLETLDALEKVLIESKDGDEYRYGGLEPMDDYQSEKDGMMPKLQQSNTAGINRYLENNEALQNGFSNSLNANFLNQNRASTTDRKAKWDEGAKFNFTLPPEPVARAEKPQSKTSAEKKSESLRDRTDEIAPQAPQQRSQLLEHRKQSREMAQPVPQSDSFARNNAVEPGPPMAQPNAAGQLGQPEAQVISGSINGTVAIQQQEPQISPQLAAGQLSLVFAIPEDGTRHDFVRTGGNVRLTLRMQNSKLVSEGFNLAWAAACTLAGIILIVGMTRGISSFAIRLISLLIMAGIVGWLCLPKLPGFLSLAVCCAGLILISLLIIAQSFRRSRSAAGQQS